MSSLHLEVVALWLIYAAACAAAVWLARRLVGSFPTRIGVFIALAPLVFTGKAMLLGRMYGPADLYYGHEPWKRVAAEHGIARMKNPILSDLAFANLPWRAAVREALVNGRFPFWNRFVLAGNPLVATAQAGVFHPATWLGIVLPVSLSWTFSCAFTIFLALLCGFLFFLDFRLRPLPALVGAVAWGFSTYVLFWDGWSVGPSVAELPLLLLGLRRIAAGGGSGIGITVVALLLSFTGGHPETFFHCVAAGGVYFLWELAGRRRNIPRAAGSALAAGFLALLLAGPQLFPLLEAIRNSAEYRARRSASVDQAQSVSVREAAARLLPAVLPFAHGIFGKSPVQGERNDGSGMPLGYAGAMLFPLAAWGSLGRRQPPASAEASAGKPELSSAVAVAKAERGRSIFLAFLAAGLLLGASAPGLIDVLSRLPFFSLALNYRLVVLAALGLAGLAAFGAQRICDEESWRGLAAASVGVLILLFAVFLGSRGVFRERALPDSFVRASFFWEVLPVGLLAAAALLFPRGRRIVLLAAPLLLVAQRAVEMHGIYPTLRAGTLAPSLPALATLPAEGPYRIVAAGDVFRPNGAALYGLEDARGYESLILDRFADTFALWSKPQFASFNRVDDLASPFLSFLNVRYAIAPPDILVPALWRERERGREMAVLENSRVLPRAFAPKTIRFENDRARMLAAMGAASDFFETAWVRSRETGERANGPAEISIREIGPDLRVTVSAPARVFVATSLPDWPGWSAEGLNGSIALVTVNHAFVGFWAGPGRETARFHYRPASFLYGLITFAIGLAAAAAFGFRARRSSG